MFRYALERWPASPYEAVIFHRGALAEPQQALVARLAGTQVGRALPGRASVPASPNIPLNVIVRTVDLGTSPAQVGRAVPSAPSPASALTLTSLPGILLRYPQGAAAQGDVWSGPLSEAAVNTLRDSPLRRRIAQRLIKGESAVWVLLESGDQSEDEAAARLLRTRLAHLQETLTLPMLDPEDIADRVVSAAERELKVAFSVFRLARTDPAEQLLVRLLLGSEDDLRESKEPIAFPIFGRGRILYALVGKGINNETIDEACSFLTGPCSCVVKEENPGVDLLMAADWDNLVRVLSPSDQALPQLTGLTALPPLPQGQSPGGRASPRAQAFPPPGPSLNACAATAPAPVPSETRPGSAANLLKTCVRILGGLAALALAGTAILRLRRKGCR